MKLKTLGMSIAFAITGLSATAAMADLGGQADTSAEIGVSADAAGDGASSGLSANAASDAGVSI